ncbi:MAG TPA: polyprenyl diphosphate synthase, partial [Cyclobacteriaceae bacterium]|nr:polyprenyl diphosphate synthase [Cyclobacteriaceae bacterium]
DGNGRWAKKKGAIRVYGHQNAIKSVKDITEGCAELGIRFLTLYAFSTENWARPKEEVDNLMRLLVTTIRNETKTLMKNNVRLLSIGDIQSLPVQCQAELAEAIDITGGNMGLRLVLALSYSGRWDIIQGIRQLITDVRNNRVTEQEINPDLFTHYLSTAGIPDPELLIRTSGEMRISNFLLWQIAYTEIYITETLWPDFRKENLYEAIISYQKRERRFGKISEQSNL